MVKGHSPRAIVASARRRYLPLLRRNWAFWVPVQFSFFTLVRSSSPAADPSPPHT